MRPRVDEILDCITESFDTYIAPEVTEPFASTLVLTIGGLLRQVRSRVELEGQGLLDDVHDVRGVLESVADYLDDGPLAASPAWRQAAAAIRELLAREFRGEREYPTLMSLTDEATALRGALDDALRILQAAKPELAADPHYEKIRGEIRKYIATQLCSESAWTFGDFTASPR